MLSHFVADVLGNTVDAHFSIQGVSIDSRSIKEGELFIAIRGPNFDGHDFVASAVKNGASAVVVEQASDSIAAAQFIVEDTTEALQQLAHAWRLALKARVIGITGSNGKTTVKEMTRAALSNHKVHATAGNFNNLIGLPLTILAAPEDTEILILELGMSEPGEMAKLADIARPDVICITNAANAHTEGVGGIEGVRREKGAIIEGLTSKGCAVLNRDDAGFFQWQQKVAPLKVLSFGLSDKSDFHLQTDKGYVIEFDGSRTKITSSFKGEHNFINATAVCAIAFAINEQGVMQTLKNLESYQAVKGRLDFITRNTLTIIDDSYNANPASVKAGIDVLAAEEGPSYLVLGNMAELGKDGLTLHQEVFTYAKNKNIDRVYGLGDMASIAAEEVGGSGYSDMAALLKDLMNELTDGATVLVKGSRSMGMERVVEALIEPDSKESRAC